MLGDGGAGETIPAEFCYPKLFHKRGALAMARENDDVNPDKRSSDCQFYIVWGKTFNDEALAKVQKRIDERTKGTVKLTPEIAEYYKKIGGTPHLDGSYTVFGEVVAGLNIVDKIQQVKTDENDRPQEDIKIIRTKMVKKGSIRKLKNIIG
jgi:peptidyl-prolyl cis-trans isomerase B (cyclophilin B)